MDVKVPAGRYILGVSGGVDSMALLHLLSQKPGLKLVVAHFNHGIRKDSYLDEKLVAEAADRYDLPIELGHGGLGGKVSEEQARNARYKFLTAVKDKNKAESIITAHHQDDLIETALINMLRGSGRRGLTAISRNSHVLRPLLKYPKKDIHVYARKHKLSWREDTTNLDNSYLRNYVRSKLMPNLSMPQRKAFLGNLDNIAKTNIKIDEFIATLSQNVINNRGDISRRAFIDLPTDVGKEVVMYWLRGHGLENYDRKTVERINNVIRTAPPGTIHEVINGNRLIMKNSSTHFSNT